MGPGGSYIGMIWVLETLGPSLGNMGGSQRNVRETPALKKRDVFIP